MIFFGCTEDVNSSYDEIWYIVRSLKFLPDISNTITKQITLLSPSPSLFQDYLKWRRQGQWNERTFQTNYVPRFLQELKDSQTANQLLDTLHRVGSTKNILLVCHCKNEFLCHRSIIHGILQGMDEADHTQTTAKGFSLYGESYEKYYHLYQNTIKGEHHA